MVVKKKICLVGDFAVGKTSLIRRYVDRQFDDQYLSTVGVKISCKPMAVPQATGNPPVQLDLLIWDLEGQNQFEPIKPSYLQGASGAIIVGAVDRQTTVDSMAGHIQLFLTANPKQPVVISLNKADLISSPAQQADLDQFCRGLPAGVVAYHLTSAKTGDHVDDLFETLALAMMKAHGK